MNCTAGSRSGAIYVGGRTNLSSLYLADCALMRRTDDGPMKSHVRRARILFQFDPAGRDSSSTPFTVAGELLLRHLEITERGDQHACVTADTL